MKKLGMNIEALFRFLIGLFVFCMAGVLMQIIAPPFPDRAMFMGILFFATGTILAAVIWMLRPVVRKERLAAAGEKASQ